MGKKVKKHLQRGLIGLLLCQIVIALGGTAAFAATPAPSVNTSTNTLKVSPVRSDVTVAPGASSKVSTFITNLTAAPILVHPIENDFVAGDEKGTPSLVLDENSYAPTHSLKRFMVPLTNITVAPGETKQVDVTITVPKTAQAGGYFGAIRFAPAADGSGRNVNLSASVASLILMTVPGPATEQLNLTNFDVQQNGSTGSNFRTPEDIGLLLRFENKGNLQESPFGQIYVQKGKKVVYTYNFNQKDPRQTILPDSARRWDIPLKGFGKFGKYKVGGTLTYGSTNKTITVSKTVWIIPTTYIIGFVVGILLLVGLIVGTVIGLKAYKRRILRGSGYHNNRRR
jgi:hypothetical protein